MCCGGWPTTRRPFFVTMNYRDVHDPSAPAAVSGQVLGGPKPGGLINSELHVPVAVDPEQIESEIDAYDGALAYVDDQFAHWSKACGRATQPRAARRRHLGSRRGIR